MQFLIMKGKHSELYYPMDFGSWFLFVNCHSDDDCVYTSIMRMMVSVCVRMCECVCVASLRIQRNRIFVFLIKLPVVMPRLKESRIIGATKDYSNRLRVFSQLGIWSCELISCVAHIHCLLLLLHGMRRSLRTAMRMSAVISNIIYGNTRNLCVAWHWFIMSVYAKCLICRWWLPFQCYALS